MSDVNVLAQLRALRAARDAEDRTESLKLLRERLEGFRELESDWDSYQAVPIDKDAIDMAHLVLAQLDPLEADVFPTSDGGVMFEWHTASGTYTIEIQHFGHVGS